MKNRGYKSDHRLWATWCNMKRRCYDIKDDSYSRYGGRGILICEHWLNFWNFVDDMFPSHKEGLTLDRIDNDSGYSKDNCRWATRNQQQNNMSSNSIHFYKGELRTLSEISNMSNIRGSTLVTRMKVRGLTITEAVEYKKNSKERFKGRDIEYKGCYYTGRSLAKLLDIPSTTFNSYIRKGMSVEEIIEYRKQKGL